MTIEAGPLPPDPRVAAEWYAQHGFPVFPVHSACNGRCSCGDRACRHPAKHPRTEHGFKDATTDAAQIAQWWRKWPDANVGIPTGQASGLLVLDIDPRNGGDESLETLIAKQGPIPETAEQITGGGGLHIFFRNRGGKMPKTLAAGIDLKGDGGYVVVAPSIHESGDKYRWAGTEGANALLRVSDPPPWIPDLIAASQTDARTSDKPGKKWTAGSRNDKLASLGGSMRRPGMSAEAIEAALLEENRLRCDPPLPESEVRRIARSISSYKPAGKAIRRSRPDACQEFRLTDDAVLYIDSDSDREPLKICGRLEIVALTRDATGHGWGRLLQWTDAEGRLHRWLMPMSLLAGDGNDYRARLLDGGLLLSPGRKARELLTVYLQTTRVDAKALCVPQVGWQTDNFVLPNATIGPDGHETVLLQTPHESECLLNEAGTLEEWKENVGKLCPGNSRLLFAVSCAFVGPLLTMMGSESGGVHFFGGSSTGKSTALLVGGSVLGGGGRNGFVQSWRTTTNGLEGIADLHNDLTLFLDELSQIDAREAVDVAYLLANGSGKTRMARNMGMRKKLTWSLVFVSSGEVTLSDHAQTAGKRVRAGADVRLLNIDADAGVKMGLFEDLHGSESPDAFALQLKGAARRFYGTPLRPWLKFIVHERSTIEKALQNFQRDFLNKHVAKAASGEVFRAAQRFALIAAAGELGTDAGLTSWCPGNATDAASKCFESWIGQRGTIGARDTEAAINQVRQYLETHGASRFQVIRHVSRAGVENNPDEAQVVRDRAGFRRRDSDSGETEYLVFAEAFKTEVCAGYSYELVRKVLYERGYLIREAPHWTIKPRSLPEMPKGTRVYCIRAAILEDAE